MSGLDFAPSLAFLRVAELAIASGVTFNGGGETTAWVHTFKDSEGREWSIGVNGNRTPVEDPRTPGAMIPPINCIVLYNGWPFGVFDPGGGVCARGSEGNEDNLIAALEAEIRRLGGDVSDSGEAPRA